jgi:hypothetical protein
MDSAAVLADAFERIRSALGPILDGLSDKQLAERIGQTGNSIAWLSWHLTRVQDDHVADAFGVDQIWVRDGWHSRFDLPLDTSDTGYGHSPDQVASVVVAADLLVGYHEAVCAQTLRLVSAVEPSQLDVVVDDRWDPAVTLGVRLVSVIADDLQHIGQAAFARGLLAAE